MVARSEKYLLQLGPVQLYNSLLPRNFPFSESCGPRRPASHKSVRHCGGLYPRRIHYWQATGNRVGSLLLNKLHNPINLGLETSSGLSPYSHRRAPLGLRAGCIPNSRQARFKSGGTTQWRRASESRLLFVQCSLFSVHCSVVHHVGMEVVAVLYCRKRVRHVQSILSKRPPCRCRTISFFSPELPHSRPTSNLHAFAMYHPAIPELSIDRESRSGPTHTIITCSTSPRPGPTGTNRRGRNPAL